MVEESILAGIERFVYISTVSVYGYFEGDVELDEASDLVYGHSEENEFTVRIAQALKKKINIPNGKPIRMSYSCTKLKNDLAYRPIKIFEETVVQLEKQARSWILTHEER